MVGTLLGGCLLAKPLALLRPLPRPSLMAILALTLGRWFFPLLGVCLLLRLLLRLPITASMTLALLGQSPRCLSVRWSLRMVSALLRLADRARRLGFRTSMLRPTSG